MENDLTRLSLLAIDIADPEIRSLQETNEQITKSMIKAGIPQRTNAANCPIRKVPNCRSNVRLH